MKLKQKSKEVKKHLKTHNPSVKFSVRTYTFANSGEFDKIVIRAFNVCDKTYSWIKGQVEALSESYGFDYDLMRCSE